jgi:hypothetical protein
MAVKTKIKVARYGKDKGNGYTGATKSGSSNIAVKRFGRTKAK